MRVCLVSPYPWSSPVPVAEHVESLSRHLEHRGHLVRVICPHTPRDGRSRSPTPKPVRLGGCPGARPGTLPSRVIPVPASGSLANVAFSPRALRRVKEAVRLAAPEVMHLHEPLSSPVSGFASRVARQAGIPLVGTFHASYPGGCSRYRLFRPFLAPLAKALNARVAVSPAAAATAAEHFPGEYEVIPDGVEVGRLRNSDHEREERQILFFGPADGRAGEREGLRVLLRAFQKVVEVLPAARLVIVGCRPEDVQLPKGVSGRLSSSIEVWGRVDAAGLAQSLRRASVLCAPTLGGGPSGKLLLEAMAAGLPVVASDLPGYSAVVSSRKDGILVPPGEAAALARELVRVLSLRQLRERLAAEGEETAARYSWPRVTDEIERVYRRARGA